MKKKILFIDRDGTLIVEPKPSEQVDSMDKLEFMPGVISALSRLVKEGNYRLVMVTNQDGLGTASFPFDDFIEPQQMMLKVFASEGIFFDEILIDHSFAAAPSPNRKPSIGLVKRYMNNELDYENSYVIGDRATDIQLAANMGIGGIAYQLSGEQPSQTVFSTDSWSRLVDFLLQGDRRVTVERTTSETNIIAQLDLNGTGKADIATGIGFFDHMLEQIARHGSFDLTLKSIGDLHIDEHHTIEDCGITLGTAFKDALGKKWGINRYAFSLPMDESEATIRLDLGGRAYLNWDVTFQREFIGDMPTEMIKHFFLSFIQSAGCTLHIEAKGENNHHKVEGLFKAFGKVLKEAVALGGSGIPSSKGVI
ncbi:MAG: bifunctional histidinol-phosphatase/imidazoleglycerol-phosphate dehydratase HisB [Marinifilaceae bacterium]